MRHRINACMCVGCLLLASAPSVHAQCQPSWDAAFGVPGIDGPVYTLDVLDNINGASVALHAGGIFQHVNGLNISSVARWDGNTWSGFGTGPAGIAYTLAAYDDGISEGNTLYAGGGMFHYIKRWNGTSWLPLPMPGGTVYSTAVFDSGNGSGPLLYAGGDLLFYLGAMILVWNGTAWSTTGSFGVSDVPYAMLVYDDGSGPALFVGGTFSQAGNGIPADGIAKWDGQQWHAVGSLSSAYVLALATFDDGSGLALYAAGGFNFGPGQGFGNVAKWDGRTWTNLGQASNPPHGPLVHALAAFDDGSGPALYAGGLFVDIGGVPANNIAKWDGKAWSPLGSGVGGYQDASVDALASFDDGSGPALYAGGDFSSAGGHPAFGIARWRCAPCPADIAPSNGDGQVDATDLMAVIDNWGPCPTPCPPNCTADANHDCNVNVGDLLMVINTWGACSG